MTTYIVTFEIVDASRRTNFKVQLRSMVDQYCPIHENAFAIMTDYTATQIRDMIMQYSLPLDRIFIVRSGTEAAWKNAYGQENTDWLKKNL